MERVRRATRIANIDTFIDALPLGYNTKIGADGHGLSVGQKQEASDRKGSLQGGQVPLLRRGDQLFGREHERTIMERLDRLFENKTVVVVAHRPLDGPAMPTRSSC